MKILECYSKGDRRFSALYAKLADGRTIEEVYQSAKRDQNGNPYPKGRAKKKPCHYLHILGINVPCSHAMRHTFYTMLWWIWLMENPELAEEATTYEGFRDIYDGHGGIVHQKGCSALPDTIEDSACQARAIAFLISEGNLLFMPHVLQKAMDAYWLRNHGEILTKQKDVEEAEHAMNVLLSAGKEAIACLDPEILKRLRAKLESVL